MDVSHLLNGSKVNIVSKNIILESSRTGLYDFNTAYATGVEALNNLQGDSIVIQYFRPTYNVTGIDFVDYANPEIIAYLEGDTLYMEHVFEQVQVILLPIWSMASPFYSHEVAPKEPIMGQSRLSRDARIYIGVK